LTAKIAFLDIETTPNLSWTWGKWDQNVIEFEQEWFILSYAYKWLGEEKIYCQGLIDFHGYEDQKTYDGFLMQGLWQVFDEADIIVAHNGDNFDVKKSNARFVVHDQPPPSTYKTIDTLKVVKKNFRFDSNKLEDVCIALGIGSKLPHTGFALWKGCMAGDPEAWELMKAYNSHDVELVEQLYLKIRPWIKNHPNLTAYTQVDGCTNCGSENVQKRGVAYARTRTYQRWHCKDCRTWYQGKLVK
jgi:hypothetical protein